MARSRRADWQQVVEEYRRSGLTQAEFSDRQGLKVSTLQSWLYRPDRSTRGGRRPSPSPRPMFLPVTIRDGSRGTGPASDDMELVLVGGHTLRFRVGTDASYIGALVEQLSAAGC